ncbi:hypothetical protein AB0J63_21415 [Streptosporangium canum]|uniref:hypothetical protein n=1 Tax=Streptosporangium canum TaxID=324952 RepID=UPI00341F3118
MTKHPDSTKGGVSGRSPDRWSAWLDENGTTTGRPVNHHATALARCCGLEMTLRGPVIVTGIGPEDGTAALLTAEQITAIRNKITARSDGGSGSGANA